MILPKGFPRDSWDIQTVSTTSWAWKKLARVTGQHTLYSSNLPVVNSLWLPITEEKLVQRTLSAYSLDTVGDLFSGGHVFSSTEEDRFSEASFMDHFVFRRLRSALRARITEFPLEPASFPPLTLLTANQDGAHLISKLYRASDINPKQTRQDT